MCVYVCLCVCSCVCSCVCVHMLVCVQIIYSYTSSCMYTCSRIKRLRVHMSQSHPGLPREELDRLTGYKHKMQGKMGGCCCVCTALWAHHVKHQMHAKHQSIRHVELQSKSCSFIDTPMQCQVHKGCKSDLKWTNSHVMSLMPCIQKPCTLLLAGSAIIREVTGQRTPEKIVFSQPGPFSFRY